MHQHEALRDIVDGNRELAPLGRQPLIGQPIAPHQQTGDHSQEGNERKQHAFAKAPH